MILCLQHQRPDGEIDSYYLKPGRRYHIGRGSVCEVRILDLKLSRKHCALEFVDNGWQAVDLMSTNGCTVDGKQIVGNIAVQPGSVIEAGQSKLTVAAIFDPATAEEPLNEKVLHQAKVEVEHDHDHTETTTPSGKIEQELMPEGPANAVAKIEANRSNEWEPEPNTDVLNKTDALIPTRREEGAGRRPNAVFRADAMRFDDEQDNLNTSLHTEKPQAAPVEPAAIEKAPVMPVETAPAAPTIAPATDSQERTFFITVLGRRVGPLTRSAARDLKARELKGTLTTADLEQYPLG